MYNIKISEEKSWSNQMKEMFRTLRTNIEFTGVENRVIAITSCSPNDGKSMVVYNLAKSFAENGKKTLIVDADLRKSVMMRNLNIEGELKGLSHYLSGQESVKDIICSTNIHNLYVIPTGVFPTNPAELLGNARFEQMIPVCKQAFDYVLIDTPPLMNVIDAAIVAKKCDGSLLVLASDDTSRMEAKRVVEQLRNANSNVLGVVLNKVDIRMQRYYGKYGRYGKKSNYGYYGSDQN